MKQQTNRISQSKINFYHQSLYVLSINNTPDSKPFVALFSENQMAAKKNLLILVVTHYKETRTCSEMTHNCFSFRMHFKILCAIHLFRRSVVCEKLSNC